MFSFSKGTIESVIVDYCNLRYSCYVCLCGKFHHHYQLLLQKLRCPRGRNTDVSSTFFGTASVGDAACGHGFFVLFKPGLELGMVHKDINFFASAFAVEADTAAIDDGVYCMTIRLHRRPTCHQQLEARQVPRVPPVCFTPLR